MRSAFIAIAAATVSFHGASAGCGPIEAGAGYAGPSLRYALTAAPADPRKLRRAAKEALGPGAMIADAARLRHDLTVDGDMREIFAKSVGLASAPGCQVAVRSGKGFEGVAWMDGRLVFAPLGAGPVQALVAAPSGSPPAMRTH